MPCSKLLLLNQDDTIVPKNSVIREFIGGLEIE